MTFLMGGGSRGDIASLPFLRFLSACAIGVAILLLSKSDLSQVKIPLFLLLSLVLLGLFQLVPIPPALWTGLPGREPIAQIDALIGLDAWRPVSLSPVLTMNAVASLTAPLAALLWFAIARKTDRVLLVFVAIGGVSALLGIIQLFADPQSGVFLYRITNSGSAVGLFANRNHQGVFLACCVMISLYLVQRTPASDRNPNSLYFGGAALLMALGVIVTASRAGLITLILAISFAILALLIKRFKAHSPSTRRQRPRLFSMALMAAVFLLGVVFVVAERVPALSRLIETDELRELRVKMAPILIDLTADFQPLGSGLGTFEYAYRMREPTELLAPSYVNEAHNDWMQFPIEGGAFAFVIIGLGIAFVIYRSLQLAKDKSQPGNPIDQSWLGLGILIILAAASVVDYPLHVPSVMAVSVIGLAIFARPTLRSELVEPSD
ncbi:hypothetical protein GRI44_00925 [Altererythrobacter confluentis]|uniref:O-antigen ligase-related domain-containing protein n=1 Tax=Allopontixanthobacter confluentis TaxID=1849021 RepID=A0A6L7GB68_9SPHN|nr:O-antigen ligase family protein [Allopontixanthobacter confluentis]MXP13322.1 hypothetical protein [Allopontixanthobacter confluentis]